MSEEAWAIIRTLFGAFLRRDVTVMEALMSPEVEWDATRIEGMLPELAGVHRGPEETRAFWGGWLSPWQDMQFEFELREADGERIVALISNQRQWGRQSGVETTLPEYAWVYTVRDGRVVHGCFYPDHRSALEAVGLSE